MHGGKPKVLVAMSGGVDSSVAAALLKQDGYEVVGCFMRLGSPGETLDELTPVDEACEVASSAPQRPLKIGHQGCCSITDAADARLVAAELNIPFYVCNFKKDFGRIIDYFVDEYANGRTPNPCVRCNDWLKFGKLHEYAKQIGADFVASGHYARVESGKWKVESGKDASTFQFPLSTFPTPRLLRGLDHSKDQSYVLFGIPRDRLSEMLLPIGGMLKPEVRDLAQKFGLPVFNKPDSQEICFVPDNDYAGLVERRRPDLAQAGSVVDSTGAVVGEHGGQHRYTIGQRRGVGVAFGYPIYVTGKDPATNTVRVGTREDLTNTGCDVGEANWLVPDEMVSDGMPCLAKYRYNSKPVPARVSRQSDGEVDTHSGRRGRFRIDFDAPQFAVAPGQALVVYDAGNTDVVLGGGWIDAVTACP